MTPNGLDNEHYEIIEGLLEMCMQKESQVHELSDEVDVLKKEITKLKHRENGDILKTPAPDTSKNRGVLIADKSALMRKNLSRLFYENGFRQQWEASCGKEVVELYSDFRPSLVTIDTELPEINGYEATRIIRRLDPDSRIVIISHVMEKENILTAIEAGASDYVIKPIKSTRLIKIIHQLFNGKAA